MSFPSSVTTDTLRRLHRLHEQLRDLNERLERGPRVSTAHANNLARLEAELAEAQAKAKELRVKTDEKQVLLKSGEANVERRRRQLREANDNREYQALLDQIAADQMANSVLEDEILESMEKLDRCAAKVKEADKAVVRSREETSKIGHEWERDAPLIRADIERLGAELRQVEGDLPGDFRDLYRRLTRAKGGNALAAILGEFCGGCNQHVPLNMVNAVMLGKPVCCKSCGRLLYMEEDRTPEK
jgi:predicted  nucleic acid-binding Zn-ribbon protein